MFHEILEYNDTNSMILILTFFLSSSVLYEACITGMRQQFSVINVESHAVSMRYEWDLFLKSWLTVCQCQDSNEQEHSGDADGGYLIPSSWWFAPHPYSVFSERTDFHLISHKARWLNDTAPIRTWSPMISPRWYLNDRPSKNLDATLWTVND